jgi:hypothetical protein
MTHYLGTKGNVKLRRGTKAFIGRVSDQIIPDDVNTSLNRLSFDGAINNILIGDRVDITTTDERGLVCFAASVWGESSGGPSVEVPGASLTALNGAQIVTLNELPIVALDTQVISQPSVIAGKSFTAYVHVNAVGGLRFFPTFTDAVNNVRANEIPLAAFTGDPLQISVRVRDVQFNLLGSVEGYEFNTDRQTIDATSLNDRFRQQLSAGLISGAGRIECEFNYRTIGLTEPSLLLLQLIQRVEIGSEFDLALYLTDKDIDPTVDTIFYNLTAVVNRSGVQVRADDIVRCAIDFVTTDEIQLVYGKPANYILKEDDDRIELEQSLDYLLQEVDD